METAQASSVTFATNRKKIATPMTLTTIISLITAAAIVLTGLTYFVLKHKDSLLISFLQNWTGTLFLFSGYVKAVDPLGTAYKMEQYFAEFESIFTDTALSFLAPMFPAMAEYSVSFSVFMIVLEIVLGLALIIGFRPKLTAWLFWLIVVFFTVLTGFTFLTGYVPSGVNFFSFGEWEAFADSNMKVTDCGCFGDFLKLEPFTSFMKDIVLLVPAFMFLFSYKKMHLLGTVPVRSAAGGILTVVTLLYCMSNYAWDIPGQDFRPFKVNADVAAVKKAEMDAAASVQTLGYKMVNKANGTVKELTTADFLQVYKDYPEAEWEYNQIVSEPAIVATKLSDFEMSTAEGDDPIPAMLEDDGYSFLIVAYKLKGDKGSWKESYVADWKEDIQPLAKAALAAGYKVYGLTKFNEDAAINDFRATIGADYPFWRGDDIMLKTIIRSNPGVVLMKDGIILGKWHHSRVPGLAEMMEGLIRTKD